jgi:hypothetical protein
VKSTKFGIHHFDWKLFLPYLLACLSEKLQQRPKRFQKTGKSKKSKKIFFKTSKAEIEAAAFFQRMYKAAFA